MELKQLSEHVYYTECDPSADRPVLGYVLGDTCTVMIDAGNSENHVRDYERTLDQYGLLKPQYCVITHWHWDHTFGMHALSAETVAHVNTNRELERLSSWVWNDEEMKRRLEEGLEIEFADQHIRAEYGALEDIRVTAADRTFQDAMTIDCGGVTCRCIHLPSAHSDDAVVVYVPEEKVLFVGDIYNDDFYHEHDRDMEKTKQLHDALAQLDFQTAVVGHSSPVSKQNILGFLKKCLADFADL